MHQETQQCSPSRASTMITGDPCLAFPSWSVDSVQAHAATVCDLMNTKWLQQTQAQQEKAKALPMPSQRLSPASDLSNFHWGNEVQIHLFFRFSEAGLLPKFLEESFPLVMYLLYFTSWVLIVSIRSQISTRTFVDHWTRILGVAPTLSSCKYCIL